MKIIMKKPLGSRKILASLLAVAFLTGCSSTSNETQSKLSLADSCKKVKEIAPKLAEGIGKAQDEPNKAKEHLDFSRSALAEMVSIVSEDEGLNKATADYGVKLTSFLDALEKAIANGSGLIDPSVTPSRDEARTAGAVLDTLCK